MLCSRVAAGGEHADRADIAKGSGADTIHQTGENSAVTHMALSPFKVQVVAPGLKNIGIYHYYVNDVSFL